MILYKTAEMTINLDRVVAIELKETQVIFWFGKEWSFSAECHSPEEAKKEYDSICNFLSKKEEK